MNLPLVVGPSLLTPELVQGHIGLASAFFLAGVLSALPLLCIVISSVLIAVLQAATQIQEQSLTFIVKTSVVGALLFFFGSAAFEILQEYFAGQIEGMISI